MHLATLFLVLTAALTLCAGDEQPFARWSGDPFEMAMAASVSGTMRRSRGRPRKFAAPSRAVTLTLPEWVLSALSDVHEDISKAVVQLTERRRPEGRGGDLAGRLGKH